MSRDLDALVAEKVMGLDVRGEAFAIFVEGEWSVHGDGDSSEWMCYAGQEPVYLPDGGPWRVDPPTLEDELGLVKYGATEAECKQRHVEQMDEWKRDHKSWGCHHHDLSVVPRYSTDIAAAWEVVEKMRRLGWPFCYYNDVVDGVHGVLFGAFEPVDNPFATEGWVHADTAPIAICLAALKALGHEPPEAPCPTS